MQRQNQKISQSNKKVMSGLGITRKEEYAHRRGKTREQVDPPFNREKSSVQQLEKQRHFSPGGISPY